MLLKLVNKNSLDCIFLNIKICAVFDLRLFNQPMGLLFQAQNSLKATYFILILGPNN